ncbi:hypothetical protein Q3G72_014863 [Acer saccharum]|nr:hypothetical protein Q3G72_014863 [Acer saccharum]
MWSKKDQGWSPLDLDGLKFNVDGLLRGKLYYGQEARKQQNKSRQRMTPGTTTIERKQVQKAKRPTRPKTANSRGTKQKQKQKAKATAAREAHITKTEAEPSLRT